MSKYQKPQLNLVADDVWAACCQAQRINGTYVKAVLTDMPGKTNRQIVNELLTDTSQITDEDREQGKLVRKYFQAFTFKVLKGTKLSEFDNTSMLISNRDIINDNYDVAVMASLPSAYERGVKRNNVDQRIKFATGGFIGKPGLKATLIKVEVLRSIWSNTYNIHWITGVTPSDEIVFFSYREGLTVGNTIVVNGTVKAHRDNSTQLSRVKII
jgi:hypothetical protein